MATLAPTLAPASATLTSCAPRPARSALRPLAAAFAFGGLVLLVAVGAAGDRATPLGSPVRGAADPCVSPAAVAAFASWPQVAAPVGDDEYEGRGERRPDALDVPASFRAFQACRQRHG
jgi:hypothetical protein